MRAGRDGRLEEPREGKSRQGRSPRGAPWECGQPGAVAPRGPRRVRAGRDDRLEEPCEGEGGKPQPHPQQPQPAGT